MNVTKEYFNDCPICLDPFDQNKENEKILDCGHRICKTPCLKEVFSKANRLPAKGGAHSCSFCKQVTVISPGELSESLMEKVNRGYQIGVVKGENFSPSILSNTFAIGFIAALVLSCSTSVDAAAIVATATITGGVLTSVASDVDVTLLVTATAAVIFTSLLETENRFTGLVTLATATCGVSLGRIVGNHDGVRGGVGRLTALAYTSASLAEYYLGHGDTFE